MFSDSLINVYQLWGKELFIFNFAYLRGECNNSFLQHQAKTKVWISKLILLLITFLVIQWNPTPLLIFTVLDYNRTHNFLSRTGGTIVKLLYSCNIEPDLYMTDQISIGKIYNVHELEFCFNVLVYLVIYMLQIFNHFWQFVGVIA